MTKKAAQIGGTGNLPAGGNGNLPDATKELPRWGELFVFYQEEDGGDEEGAGPLLTTITTLEPYAIWLPSLTSR